MILNTKISLESNMQLHYEIIVSTAHAEAKVG